MIPTENMSTLIVVAQRPLPELGSHVDARPGKALHVSEDVMPRRSKVRDLDPYRPLIILIDKNVRRFQVPMGEIVGVHFRKCAAEMSEDGGHLIFVKVVRREALRNVLHDHPWRLLVVFG